MFQIPELLKYENLFHTFSEVSDGNMANFINGKSYNRIKVMQNRRKFFKEIKIPIDRTVCMCVEHGDDIVEADEALAGESMRNYQKAVKTDALFTNKQGLYLFLLIADCLPVIIYDPKKNALALVHAGWKGVDLEIAKKSIEKMMEYYMSDAKDLVVGIGPCVYKKSFIKSNPAQKDYPKWKGFIKKAHGSNYNIDLVGFTKDQLKKAGVLTGNIFESGIDTASDERFFSHVRNSQNHISRQGRFACIVGLK